MENINHHTYGSKAMYQEIYAFARGVRNLLKFQRDHDEVGFCNMCGRLGTFRYREILTSTSPLIAAYGWNEEQMRAINTVNSLDCSWCLSKFRVRSAADALLRHGLHGTVKSIAQCVQSFASELDWWRVLETGSTGSIFSRAKGLKQVIQSELFDHVPRGQEFKGIRSEDLEMLTFADATFDAVVSLDVFEHVAHPWQAFKEVYRVLKPGGKAILTFPLESKNQETSTRALIQNGKLCHLKPPVYHLDPLSAEGVLVFTDFGMDVVGLLDQMGIRSHLERYQTSKREVEQYVLVLHRGES